MLKKVNNHKARILFLLCGVAVIAAGSIALLPSEAAAMGCRCLAEQTTAIVTGVSTVDCPWAEMDAINQAFALVPCNDTCAEYVEIIDDNNCQKFWPSGEFRVTARAHFECEICIPDM